MLESSILVLTLMATGDRSTGPSCLGSPANTSCPALSSSVPSNPTIGTKHSGSIPWPASSMNMWVKCDLGIPKDANLVLELKY